MIEILKNHLILFLNKIFNKLQVMFACVHVNLDLNLRNFNFELNHNQDVLLEQESIQLYAPDNV